MVEIEINGQKVQVEPGTTILEASRLIGVEIPTLCQHPDLPPTGACGICVVEVEGQPAFKRACCTPVEKGWKVITHSKKLREARKTVLELILSNHDADCTTCVKDKKCELQDLAARLGVEKNNLPKFERNLPLDKTSPSVVRDNNKCILCGRCIQACGESFQSVYALTFIGRGFESTVGTALDNGLGDSVCINCGQCIAVCPVGALYERSHINEVWDAINDPNKHVVVQEAPAIRVSLGEEFGMDVGAVTPGKMLTALKRLGFDRVFDTNFAADLTIMEEGTEVLGRLKKFIQSDGKDKNAVIPVITSCSPGWIKFIETFYPDLTNNLSTAKSPQQMFGALAKTFYSKASGIDASKIVSVSIMPCTAKKFECSRPEMNASGHQDVDYVLTTREFVKMIKEAGIDFANLPESSPDELMGSYTGAATIFGATGGVMEAALRTAYEVYTGEALKNVEITAVRGMKGVKEAEIPVGNVTLKVAVAHGLKNARQILDIIRDAKQKGQMPPYHFVEVMACPGGCVGGGGQPYGSTFARRARRGEGLYCEDKGLEKRKSHENMAVMKLYKEFLGEPNSELSHKLLHTTYFRRDPISGKAVEEITRKHH